MRIVAEKTIAQLSWKNNSYYLFLTNMDDPYRETKTMQRWPNKSAFCAKIVRIAFGNFTQKLLPQPTMTYFYNYLMNMVNRKEQKQANYPIQHNQVKSWKAIFCNLINIIAVNVCLFFCIQKQSKIKNLPIKSIVSLEKLCILAFSNTQPE